MVNVPISWRPLPKGHGGDPCRRVVNARSSGIIIIGGPASQALHTATRAKSIVATDRIVGVIWCGFRIPSDGSLRDRTGLSLLLKTDVLQSEPSAAADNNENDDSSAVVVVAAIVR